MIPNSSNKASINLQLDPCSDCPYPMNVLINPLSKKEGKERFSITCRECGDSWTEVYTEGDDNETD